MTVRMMLANATAGDDGRVNFVHQATEPGPRPAHTFEMSFKSWVDLGRPVEITVEVTPA